MNDAPKLLIEWSSPWEEFVSAIRPALGRSPARLAGEARTGLVPYPGILVSWVIEALLLLAVIVLPGKLASLRPYVPPPPPKYEVIYFSGEELPRTEDSGGAQAGRSGRAGGHEAYHRTQTIRVARGNSPAEKVVDAPKLNLPRSDSPVANLLAFRNIPGPAPAEGLRSSLPTSSLPQMTVVPPAPDVPRDKMRATPVLNSGIIAPSPEISRNNLRLAPQLNAAVIAPAPSDTHRDIAALHVPVVSAQDIIPPPVSAPERESTVTARLSLPAPSIIAPPPSHVTRELGAVGGAGADLNAQVVPPPTQAGTRSLDKQAVGELLGSTSVIAPPVQGGSRSLDKQSIGGILGSTNIVPPAPAIGDGASASGRGLGTKGNGAGAARDIGSAVAPPSAGGGSGGGNGIVVSSKPGAKVGVPGKGGAGSLAMSPGGEDKSGLGGSGGGAGIGRGNGAGSGLQGEGPGAGKDGVGRGSDSTARAGLSPYPGPGGAGSGTKGSPPIPGVSVHGGSTITLPSFGENGTDATVAGRSSAASKHGLGITVIASSRAGGAFNFYDKLKGDNYSIYIETSAGTAVMQFADPNSATHSYSQALTAPEPLRADLPAGLGRSRLVIACVLDRSGLIKNIRVLEAGGPDMTTKVLAALPSWKFRPVLRSDQPVEVNAILGFNIDTR